VGFFFDRSLEIKQRITSLSLYFFLTLSSRVFVIIRILFPYFDFFPDTLIPGLLSP